MTSLVSGPLARLLLVLWALALALPANAQNTADPADRAAPSGNVASRTFWRDLLGLPAQTFPPVLVRVLLVDGLPDEHRDALLSRVEQSLVTLDDVTRVEVLVGQTENHDPLVQSLFRREMLFEVHWSTDQAELQRHLIVKDAIAQRLQRWPPTLAARILETSKRPASVLSQDSYTLSQAVFIFDAHKPAASSIAMRDLAAALSSLDLSTLAGKPGTIIIAGRAYDLTELGHFELRPKHLKRAGLDAGQWAPWAPPSSAAAAD